MYDNRDNGFLLLLVMAVVALVSFVAKYPGPWWMYYLFFGGTMMVGICLGMKNMADHMAREF